MKSMQECVPIEWYRQKDRKSYKNVLRELCSLVWCMHTNTIMVTALKVLSRMKYDRLISATPIKNGNFTVHSYQGDVITGTIIDVTEVIIQFKARADYKTKADVSFPLLNNKF